MKARLLHAALIVAALSSPAGCSRTDLWVVTCSEALTPEGQCVARADPVRGDPVSHTDGAGGADGGGGADGADAAPIGDPGPCIASAGTFLGDNGQKVSIYRYTFQSYVGSSFVANDDAGAICGALVSLTKTGTPSGSLHASIWSDDTSLSPTEPLVQISEESPGVVAASVVDGTDTRFTGLTGATLVSGTKYWLVLRSDAGSENGSNYVNWILRSDVEPFGIVYSSDPGSWWTGYTYGRTSLQLLK